MSCQAVPPGSCGTGLSSALRHHHIIDWHTDWQRERSRSGSGGRKSMWMQWRTAISRLPEVHYWVKCSMHVSVCVCVRDRNIKAFSTRALLLYMSFLQCSLFFLTVSFCVHQSQRFPKWSPKEMLCPQSWYYCKTSKGTLNITSPVPLFKSDQLEMSHWKRAAVRQRNCEERKEWRRSKEQTEVIFPLGVAFPLFLSITARPWSYRSANSSVRPYWGTAVLNTNISMLTLWPWKCHHADAKQVYLLPSLNFCFLSMLTTYSELTMELNEKFRARKCILQGLCVSVGNVSATLWKSVDCQKVK